MRSADPTAKQIIRNKVSLQTEHCGAVGSQAARSPLGRGEACVLLPVLPSPLLLGTGLGALSPPPLGVSEERPLRKVVVRSKKNSI